jgi:colanic acid biosynthesis protein WcaH
MTSEKVNGILPKEDFLKVVEHAPLVAVDLVIRAPDNSFLLGLRKNAPAKGTWYFPGGRIFKDERIEQAFKRIAFTECYFAAHGSGKLLSVNEYFFQDNFAGKPGVSTHYVTLVYEVWADKAAIPVHPDGQHSMKRWFTAQEVVSNEIVHVDVKRVIAKLFTA